MKKATTRDVVALVRVIKKLDLREELNKAQQGSNNVEEIGFNAFYKIIEKVSVVEIEEEFYQAMARPFEMTSQEVGDLPIMELIEKFKECYDIGALLNFMKQVN